MKKFGYFFVLALLLCKVSEARTIRVGKNGQYSSIQKAVDAAVAGDTVWVEKGVYREKNLLINKSIILIGSGFPVLDGEDKFEIISVKANRVVVKGFKIIHSGISSMEDIAGIKIYNVRDVIISGNVFEETFFGVYVQSGTNCTVENNQLKASSQTEQQSGNGIHCWKSDSMRITGNTIIGHRDGIYFEFVTNSIISGNLSKGNIRYGLHFMFSHNDAYISNVFRNNGAGVSVMFTRGVKMLNNSFEDNWGDGSYGLLLKEISDSYISGNKFNSNTCGIFMEGASRTRIEKNVFRSNGWGMRVEASCMDNVITKNNFFSNSFDVGTNGTLVLNTFNNNYWDKYEGYDLNKDKVGDIPYHPLSLFSVIVERNPPAMLLFRSFMSSLLDKAEKMLPSLTPENLRDDFPYMKPVAL